MSSTADAHSRAESRAHGGGVLRAVRPLVREVKGLAMRVAYGFFSATERMDPTAVCMLSERRLSQDGNMVAIMRAMAGTPLRAISLEKPHQRDRRGARGALKTLRTMARCRYIVLEEPSPIVHRIRPREGQSIIQTWHASGPFKKVGYSRLGMAQHPGTIYHSDYSFAIVGSEASRAPYAEAFGMPIRDVLPLGLPRTDRFADAEHAATRRAQILSEHPELAGKRVVLFAPTFRGTDGLGAHYEYDRLDFDRLAEKIGPGYAVLLKPHPFTLTSATGAEQRRQIDDIVARHPDTFFDFSEYPDVNDLLFVTDVLVTDYSSILFEYALVGGPLILFAYDYEQYLADRGFYFDFSEYAYGPVVRTTDELAEAIVSARTDEVALARFRERFLSACDGRSAERFIATLLTE